AAAVRAGIARLLDGATGVVVAHDGIDAAGEADARSWSGLADRVVRLDPPAGGPDGDDGPTGATEDPEGSHRAAGALAAAVEAGPLGPRPALATAEAEPLGPRPALAAVEAGPLGPHPAPDAPLASGGPR
ncbi:MAG TPA: hypothetical protein VD813_02825, partial [Pseudonocardia sp.]|nr:hypothetical protein [Pseudonocardia sp.]